MGWMIEQAKQHRLRSGNAVAHGMWKHEPCRKRKGELSRDALANNLRRLDRGEMLDWWLADEHRVYRRALAEVLQMDISDVEAAIQRAGHVTREEDGRYFHFEVFPRLQPIDLDTEAPFPGIPPALLVGDGPHGRIWWHAPPGSGRTLVGKWLSRRHGWGTDAALAPAARTFLESDDPPAEALRARRIVVASVRPAPPASEWIAVTTPVGWAETLVEWACARVRSGGLFDAHVARRWVREGGARSIDTPGRLLEVLACLDQAGERALRGNVDPRPALAAWTHVHASRADRPVGLASRAFLRDHGAEVLVQIERARRTQRLPVDAASVARCIPPTAPPPSADTVLELLEQGPQAVRAGVRPQGPEIALAMEKLRWLIPGGWGFPSLVSGWLRACVIAAAADAPLPQLGAMLDQEDIAPELVLQISSPERLGRFLDQVGDLDLDDPDSAIALDGLAKAVTLCVARGGVVNTARLARLSRALADVSLPWSALPTSPLRVKGLGAVEHPWWAVSMMVVHRRRAASRSSALTVALAAQAQLVEAVVVRRSEDPPGVGRELRCLAVRLLQDLPGTKVPGGTPRGVGLVMRDLRAGRALSDEDLGALALLGPIGFVADLCAQEGVALEMFATCVWPHWLKSWGSSPFRDPGEDVSTRSHVRTVWSVVNTDVMGADVVQPTLEQAARGVELPEHVWRRLVEIGGVAVHRRLGALAPLALVREFAPREEWACAALWTREPVTAETRIDFDEPDALGRWLRTAPDHARGGVLDRIEAAYALLRATAASVVSDWLVAQVLAATLQSERRRCFMILRRIRDNAVGDPGR